MRTQYQIKKHPLLTPDEEVALARRAQSGPRPRAERDEADARAAVDKLVRHNQALALMFATRAARKDWRTTPDELYSAGLFGLYQAAQRYRPDAGVRFATYATFWVKNEIQRLRFELTSGACHVPVNVRESLTSTTLARRKYRPPGEILAAAGRSLGAVSLGIFEHGAAFLQGPSAEDPGEEEARRRASARLAAWMDRLDDRERAVIQARFGIGGDEESLADVGERLGLSRERVRQIEVAAIGRLQRAAGVPETVADEALAKRRSRQRVARARKKEGTAARGA